jgi:hypothetical protein
MLSRPDAALFFPRTNFSPGIPRLVTENYLNAMLVAFLSSGALPQEKPWNGDDHEHEFKHGYPSG